MSHDTCICGHKDNRHEDREYGSKFGAWGNGSCELCGCKSFQCKKCSEIEESQHEK